jgi:hypothetical protein
VFGAFLQTIVHRLEPQTLNGVHNNKSEDKDRSEKKNRSEEESGELKGQRVAKVRASILPNSGGSKQQKAKKKGPAIKDGRL